jgi:hypothetical protein
MFYSDDCGNDRLNYKRHKGGKMKGYTALGLVLGIVAGLLYIVAFSVIGYVLYLTISALPKCMGS